MSKEEVKFEGLDGSIENNRINDILDSFYKSKAKIQNADPNSPINRYILGDALSQLHDLDELVTNIATDEINIDDLKNRVDNLEELANSLILIDLKSEVSRERVYEKCPRMRKAKFKKGMTIIIAAAMLAGATTTIGIMMSKIIKEETKKANITIDFNEIVTVAESSNEDLATLLRKYQECHQFDDTKDYKSSVIPKTCDDAFCVICSQNEELTELVEDELKKHYEKDPEKLKIIKQYKEEVLTKDEEELELNRFKSSTS